MGCWHEPYDDGCVVCLAGSVMAQTLGVPVTEYAIPCSIENSKQLRALNAFRNAHLDSHMKHACDLISATPIEWSTPIPPYHVDREGFHREMTALARAFEESGQ